ncbi:hypothetical protein BDZ94DRAFT_1275161 [Collybia nuda]|uniref:Uncharacterized protein n=1 Tax=Collybia nuda TaxID=64659 RepID=A0A9P6C921_9AGAR|nr:hypothetical protein BDZ94DRAFT_1275161 [Collybia nuda]
MAAFSLIEARVASFYAETVVLGIYLITFCETLMSLFSKGSQWKKVKDVNHVMLTVVFLIFFNTVISTALSFTVIWEGLVLAPPGSIGESFTEPSYWPVVVKSSLLLFQTVIADAILIYRCWIAYFRSPPLIAFPVLLWLAAVACAILIIFHSGQLHIHAVLSARRIRPFGVAFWASSVALNIITTSLLIWRLWRESEEHPKRSVDSLSIYNRNTLVRVMHVTIRSGVLYTIVSFITFVTYTVGHNALHIATGTEIGVAGIVFNLIIARMVNGGHVDKSASKGMEGGLPMQIMGPKKASGTADNKGHVRYLVSHEPANDDYTGLVGTPGAERSKTRLE